MIPIDRHDEGSTDAQQQQDAAAASAAAGQVEASSLLIVASTKQDLAVALAQSIVRCAAAAVKERGAFTIALSGGSLPGLLTSLLSLSATTADDEEEKDPPQFDQWHVILADERMVPLDHPDSNLGDLNKLILSKLPIPSSQIYGPRLPDRAATDPDSDDDDSEAIAAEYETVVRSVLAKTGRMLDLAVLGFGPDGHTCSLFPDHPLLHLGNDNGDGNTTAPWVASISDSPKPPPRRITLTLPMLNQCTRNVIFCGAGPSKGPILHKVFASATSTSVSSTSSASMYYRAILSDPPPYPCAMVRPGSSGSSSTSVTWIVDADAAQGIVLSGDAGGN